MGFMEIKDIEHLASLARIELAETEKESLLKETEAILEFVDQVREVDVNMDASERLGAVHNVMRVDGAAHEDELHTDALLAEAPESDNGYLRVKKIL